METKNQKFSILFVCLGNICRSPMAEAIFYETILKNQLQEKFSKIQSAGTAGYHVGDSPDPRTIGVCRKHQVPISSRAQQIQNSDFKNFDFIIAMDRSNLQDIQNLKPSKSKAQVKLFGEFGDGKIIEDPYYGSHDGFEEGYQQCKRYSVGLLQHLGFDSVIPID